MRASRTRLVAAALALTVGLGAAPARADTWQNGWAIGAGAVLGAADVFFIAYDLTLAERNKSPPRSAVIVELSVMTLQLAVGLSMFATGLQSDQRLDSLGIGRDVYLPLGAVLAVVAAPLLAHSVRHSIERVGGGMHTLNLVPLRVGDQRASGPGLALVGRF